MTKEEISRYAFTHTSVGSATIISFIDGSQVTGYFEGNNMHGDFYNANKWNFVKIPITNQEKKYIVFDGNLFQSIKIVVV